MSHCVWIPKTEDALLRVLGRVVEYVVGEWAGLVLLGSNFREGIYWGACVSESVLVRGTLGNR